MRHDVKFSIRRRPHLQYWFSVINHYWSWPKLTLHTFFIGAKTTRATTATPTSTTCASQKQSAQNGVAVNTAAFVYFGVLSRWESIAFAMFGQKKHRLNPKFKANATFVDEHFLPFPWTLYNAQGNLGAIGHCFVGHSCSGQKLADTFWIWKLENACIMWNVKNFNFGAGRTCNTGFLKKIDWGSRSSEF